MRWMMQDTGRCCWCNWRRLGVRHTHPPRGGVTRCVGVGVGCVHGVGCIHCISVLAEYGHYTLMLIVCCYMYSYNIYTTCITYTLFSVYSIFCLLSPLYIKGSLSCPHSIPCESPQHSAPVRLSLTHTGSLIPAQRPQQHQTPCFTHLHNNKNSWWCWWCCCWW